MVADRGGGRGGAGERVGECSAGEADGAGQEVGDELGDFGDELVVLVVGEVFDGGAVGLDGGEGLLGVALDVIERPAQLLRLHADEHVGDPNQMRVAGEVGLVGGSRDHALE